VRLDMDGEVRYQFDNLLTGKKYQVNFTFYEGDGGKRNEEVWIDGIFTGVSVSLGDGQIHYEHADVLDGLYKSDSSIIVSIKKTKGIGAVVSEIALEEQTTLKPSPCLLGDVSGNGEVTAFDASLILRAVVGLIPFPDNPDYPCFTLENADVSGNGSLSALDAAMILQYTVRLIDIFPAQQPTTKVLAYRQFTRQMFVDQISDDASVAQISNLAKMEPHRLAKIESWATSAEGLTKIESWATNDASVAQISNLVKMEPHRPAKIESWATSAEGSAKIESWAHDGSFFPSPSMKRAGF